MKPINPGEYRHHFTILEKAPLPDSSGDDRGPWVPVMTRRGRMVPLAGREFFAADRLNAELTARAYTRYSRAITDQQQLRWCGKTFAIIAAVDIEGLHRELELRLVEMPVGQPVRNPE
jgi:SPP1 family predicted phage head-tail adaptor